MSVKGFRHFLITEAALAALQERAEKHNVSVEVLQEVFDRGVSAWDESTQKTPDQYAFNRVDSFLSGGFAAKLDSDLTEMRSDTYNNYIRKSKHVIDHTPEESKVHKKAKTGIARAERLLNKKNVKEEVDEMLSEDKIRHSTENRAYVETHKAGDKIHYKASNKHGKVKFFNEYGRKSAFKHAGIDDTNINEDSLSNVVDNSGEELKEGTPIELTKLLAMRYKDTRKQKVYRKWNERKHGLRDFHRIETVWHHGFHTRKTQDKFIDYHRHQKTDRFNTQKRQRVAVIRDRSKHHTDKQVKVTEGAEYIEARKKLHDAHHESARLHAGMERDPELRRLDLHRAKRHKHASRVLEIIQAKKNKGKDKDKDKDGNK